MFPIFLSLFSFKLLALFERCLLGFYSIDMVNAAASSWQHFMTVMSFFIKNLNVNDISMSQHNGAKRISEGTVLFGHTLFLAIVFATALFPLVFFGYKLLPASVHTSFGGYYITFLFASAIFWLISLSIESFFVGLSKSYIVAKSSLLYFICQFTLDVILISGFVFDLKMGLLGLGISTLISELFNCCFYL